MSALTPLRIVVVKDWYEEFLAGRKDTEYRRVSRVYNERSC